jgi:putative phosphoesterase
MPRGQRRIPEACLDAMRAADTIVHAGDFSESEVLASLRELGPPIVAVHGNVDSPELKAALPTTTEFDAGALRIGVIHDAGRARSRLARMRARFPDCDAVVFGHSHLPLHEESDGFHIFNPGSPTERRQAPHHSFGILDTGTDVPVFRHVLI